MVISILQSASMMEEIAKSSMPTSLIALPFSLLAMAMAMAPHVMAASTMKSVGMMEEIVTLSTL